MIAYFYIFKIFQNLLDMNQKREVIQPVIFSWPYDFIRFFLYIILNYVYHMRKIMHL